MSDLRATRSTRFAQLVGLELKGEFAKHGYSQGKVADELGHSRGGYSKWINAKPSMPMEAFLNTCELIDVDPRNVMDAAYSRLIEEMGPVQSEPNTQPPAGERLSDSFIDDIAAHPEQYGVVAYHETHKLDADGDEAA